MAATEEARRPRTRPSASTTYQARVISVTFGENVRTRPIFRIRVVSEPSPDTRPEAGLRAPGGPASRHTRIEPLEGVGKPPHRTGRNGSGGRTVLRPTRALRAARDVGDVGDAGAAGAVGVFY